MPARRLRKNKYTRHLFSNRKSSCLTSLQIWDAALVLSNVQVESVGPVGEALGLGASSGRRLGLRARAAAAQAHRLTLRAKADPAEPGGGRGALSSSAPVDRVFAVPAGVVEHTVVADKVQIEVFKVVVDGRVRRGLGRGSRKITSPKWSSG